MAVPNGAAVFLGAKGQDVRIFLRNMWKCKGIIGYNNSTII